MTDMERRLIEIQSILESLLHRVTPDGGGAGTLYVLCAIDAETGDYAINPSYEDARAALESGKNLCCVDVDNENFLEVFPMCFVDDNGIGFGYDAYNYSRVISEDSPYNSLLHLPWED